MTQFKNMNHIPTHRKMANLEPTKMLAAGFLLVLLTAFGLFMSQLAGAVTFGHVAQPKTHTNAHTHERTQVCA